MARAVSQAVDRKCFYERRISDAAADWAEKQGFKVVRRSASRLDLELESGEHGLVLVYGISTVVDPRKLMACLQERTWGMAGVPEPARVLIALPDLPPVAGAVARVRHWHPDRSLEVLLVKADGGTRVV